jgi:hypothetical protein
MPTKFEEMVAAVNEAKETLRLADSISDRMAKMLVGRLRRVSLSWGGDSALADLKRELRDFNMQTLKWKD